MNKLIAIAKECGASVTKTFFEGPYHASMTEDQLHAYTDKVCKQMVEALKAIRAEAYNNDDWNYFELADSALMNCTEIMGDKK